MYFFRQQTLALKTAHSLFDKVSSLKLMHSCLFPFPSLSHRTATVHHPARPPPPNQTSSYGMNIQISCYAVRVVHLAGVLQQLPT